MKWSGIHPCDMEFYKDCNFYILRLLRLARPRLVVVLQEPLHALLQSYQRPRPRQCHPSQHVQAEH